MTADTFTPTEIDLIIKSTFGLLTEAEKMRLLAQIEAELDPTADLPTEDHP